MGDSKDSLQARLAASLPEGFNLRFNHLSTIPERCSALYVSPPGRDPETTYCEQHTLLVTTPSPPAPGRDETGDVAVYAIEIQIYTTARLTTVFVSKADSTGFLSENVRPRGGGRPSILRSLTSTFISWIVRSRHRPDRKLVLSLFARAQNQYLFPGSVDNGKKHVLDDRGLVKWWCKSLDPVLREYASKSDATVGRESETEAERITASAHLIVPGHDPYETTAFFPPLERSAPKERKRWSSTHPLREINTYPHAPARCLVPRFPDDPKERFTAELDDEIPDASQTDLQKQQESPTKKGNGAWKSVNSLDQFWEMMAFRQECCSGRLVGFIWVVFEPSELERHPSGPPSPTTNAVKQKQKESEPVRPSATKRMRFQPTKRLTGPIVTRAPRVKLAGGEYVRRLEKMPESTRYYYWPKATRAQIVVPKKQYDRIHELLIHLDFSSLQSAVNATMKWQRETKVIAGMRDIEWDVEVCGSQREANEISSLDGAVDAPIANGSARAGVQVNVLRPQKKRKSEESVAGEEQAVADANSLSTDLIRKKPKTEAIVTEPAAGTPPQPAMNILQPRKKRKPEGELADSS